MGAVSYVGPGPRITIHTATATLPEPTDYTGGESLTSLKIGLTIPRLTETIRALPRTAILRIDADTDVTLTGPVEVLAGNDVDQKWRLVGQLAGGATFLVTANKGYSTRLYPGGDWDRLRLTSPGLDGPVTVTLTSEVTW